MPLPRLGERPAFKFPLKRGDVVNVDLSGTRGSELQDHGRGRPCVVVMRGEYHKYGLRTIVVPVSDGDGDKGYAHQVPIPQTDGLFRKDSVVDCTQIRAVDREERITAKLGEVARELMEKIDDALKHVLQL